MHHHSNIFATNVSFIALLALFVVCSTDRATLSNTITVITATSRRLQAHFGFPWTMVEKGRTKRETMAFELASPCLQKGMGMVMEMKHVVLQAADGDATVMMMINPCRFLE